MISDTLQKICNLIIEDYDPDKIILFGSHARNEEKEESDLDLLILSDSEKNKPRFKRGLELRVKLSQFIIPKDLLFFSHEDWNQGQDVPNSFVNTIAKEGKILYERKI